MPGKDELKQHQANGLLASLESRDAARLLPHLDIVPLAKQQMLIDKGHRLAHAYFPHSGVVSLMAVMREGSLAETATIGREGVVSGEALAGVERAAYRAVAQVPGTASRIELGRLRAAVEESASLRRIVLEAVGRQLVQAWQAAACSSLHPVDQRCARWLLTAHDRAGTDIFELTQQTLAEMLGVHRPSLTVAARTLQSAGLIRYRRGVIAITDRRGLEDAACECYGIIRRAAGAMLSRRRRS